MMAPVEAPPLLVGTASSFPIYNSCGSNNGLPTTITLDVGPGKRERTSSSFGSIMLCTRYPMRSSRWRIGFALDTGGSPDTNAQESFEGDNNGPSRTRLGTLVRAAAVQLIEKLNSARKNFPMKIFLLLLGFYTANALATILGQTGDWDVLVAGVVVAAIEGIGMLMYRKPFTLPLGRFQSFIVMVNYWKAGVCLGLFVDAFKLGS